MGSEGELEQESPEVGCGEGQTAGLVMPPAKSHSLQLKATASSLGFLSNKRVIFVTGLDNMPDICLISQLVRNSRWREMGVPY